MTTVVATHGVGNMDTWLAGGDERATMFKEFCTGYRVFRHGDKAQVSLVWESADLDKMKATLSSPEAAEAKARHTVLDPIEISVEVDGGT